MRRNKNMIRVRSLAGTVIRGTRRHGQEVGHFLIMRVSFDVFGRLYNRSKNIGKPVSVFGFVSLVIIHDCNTAITYYWQTENKTNLRACLQRLQLTSSQAHFSRRKGAIVIIKLQLQISFVHVRYSLWCITLNLAGNEKKSTCL